MAPSKAELERRNTVNIHGETVSNITSTAFPLSHPGEDYAWNVKRFEKETNVIFHHNEELEAKFSLTGIDASIANAFRRILLAEVPTLCIEQVYVMNNTSVMADEVFAHRIGLIPFKGNVEGLRNMKWYIKADPEKGIEGMEATDYNTAVFKLHVKCSWKTGADRNDPLPENKFNNSSVYARDIVFVPEGRQKEWFKDQPLEPANPDILLVKLRPGQELEMLFHAHLGVGKDHAKFSPVATAAYRLLPKIDIIKPILGTDAKKFQKCFPKGVIELQRVTPADAASGNPDYVGKEGDEKAVVKDPMKDTVSRECLRHDEFNGKVKLGRVQDHFIFNIESTGQYPSDSLFIESVNILKFKAKRLLRALDELERA